MLGSFDHVTRRLVVHSSPTKRSSAFVAHLVTIVQNNVAGPGLLLAQMQTQADPFDLGRDLSSLQPVPPATPPAELFCAPGPWIVQGAA